MTRSRVPLGRADSVPEVNAAGDYVRYFCPTCNLHIPADKVHRGSKQLIHLMRIPAKCTSCPATTVPHIVEEQTLRVNAAN